MHSRHRCPPHIVLLLVFMASTVACSRSAPDRPVALVAPSFTRDAAGFVHLERADSGAIVRYTLDGSDPGPRSGPYLAPIALAHGGLVRARSFSTDRESWSPLAEVRFEAIAGTPPPPTTLLACTQDRDWPLYDWERRHRATLAHARAIDAQLAFLGDSITHQFGGSPHDRPQPGREVWDRFYGGRSAANLGFGYDRIENLLWRVQHGALDSIALRAVVLNIGTNNLETNSTEEIVLGIDAVLDEIEQRQPQAEIVLMGLFPRGPSPDALREKIATVNTELARRGERERVTFLDLTSAFLQTDGTLPRALMHDFLHPTARGYEIWAEALEPVLAPMFEN